MSRPVGRLPAGLLGLLSVAGLGLVLASGPASAHATLRSTEPVAGGSLAAGAAPVLHFGEPVVLSASRLEAVTGDGAVLALAPLQHLGGDVRTLTVAPAAVPRVGTVTLRWGILAEDGHRSDGTYALVMASPATTTAPAPAPAPAAVDLLPATEAAPPPPARTRWFDTVFTAARSVGYLAMTVLCGGLAFLALAWPEGAEVRRVRRLLWSAWGLGVLTSLAGAGLQAANAGRLGLGAALDSSVVIPAFDSRTGVAWASRGLLFLLSVPVLAALAAGGRQAARSTAWRVGAAAVAVGLLRTPGLVAHSSEGRMAWLGSIADLAHLIGVAVWLGGLVVLCSVVLPRRQPDELRQVVPRFSTMAGRAVAVVVLAGSFLSWQLVGSFSALTGTRFGHVLLVKLLLVAAIAGAALLSHRWAAGRLELALASAGPAGATLRPFVMSVATEVVLAAGVLTVASVLVATSPGR